MIELRRYIVAEYVFRKYGSRFFGSRLDAYSSNVFVTWVNAYLDKI